MPLQMGFVVDQSMLGECFLGVFNVSTNVAREFSLGLLPLLCQTCFVATFQCVSTGSNAFLESLFTFQTSVQASNQSFGTLDFLNKLLLDFKISFLLQLQL